MEWNSIDELHVYLKSNLIHTKDVRYPIIQWTLKKDYKMMYQDSYNNYISHLSQRYNGSGQYAYLSAIAIAKSLSILYSQKLPVAIVESITKRAMDDYIKPPICDKLLNIEILGNYIIDFPKLAYMNIKVVELADILPKLDELLKVPKYKKFWKNGDPPVLEDQDDAVQIQTDLKTDLMEEFNTKLLAVEQNLKMKLKVELKHDIVDDLKEYFTDVFNQFLEEYQPKANKGKSTCQLIGVIAQNDLEDAIQDDAQDSANN